MATSLTRPTAADTAALAPSRRILIVDDSPVSRGVLRSMLGADRDVDWQVVEAASGDDLLAALDSRGLASQDAFAFDAVILDVRMPGLDGFEACRLLREVDPKVPILFVTADSSREGFRKGSSSGGDTYLTKPFSPTALRAALHVLTSMKRR